MRQVKEMSGSGGDKEMWIVKDIKTARPTRLA
jgi:hypothetical protein